MKPTFAYSLALACGILLSSIASQPCRADDAPKPAQAENHVTHVDAEGAAKLVDAKTVKVIDVRTPAEFQEGHINGAVNIDFNGKDFAAQVGKLDKDQAYLVHCASGGRSTKALPTFEQLGFTKIYHLDHGLKAWKSAGQPVTK